jgi:hypothetical protein
MELVMIAVLVAATAVLVLWPLIRPLGPGETEHDPAAESTREPAARAAQAAIQELEFDFATGKIDEDDYRALRVRYEAAATAEAHERAAPAAARRRIPSDEALEAEIRAARGRRFCVACGAALPAGARFCPACGRPAEIGA